MSISNVNKQEKHNADPSVGSGIPNNSSNNKETGGFGQKFTTSNFTQSVVMKSDSVFGNGGGTESKGLPPASTANTTNQNNSAISTSSGTSTKKRKSDGRITSGTNIDDINK